MKTVLSFLLLLGIQCFSQTQHKKANLAEINELTKKMYDIISFDNGNIPTYDLSSIYHKEAVIGVVDTTQVSIFTAIEFEEGNNAYFKKHKIVSFKERELDGITHFYGGVAVRYSPYEFNLKSAEREVTIRGVNTIQYVKVPELGWRVYSIFYSDNTSYPDLAKE
ncbi:hypothetical protein [Flagellimonas sp. CMM7]|uniref:hypothetical protein n=1 Tax=Flagellimonas sp. CMM7 TaxID=2654676 RepID=UPI0013D8B1D7|nr:hypothetical protein [Flagellimonas sp. CMM7]UII81127.1 hypothetical protein LV704_06325 [Flagellimonas sp. CMM7]